MSEEIVELNELLYWRGDTEAGWKINYLEAIQNLLPKERQKGIIGFLERM